MPHLFLGSIGVLAETSDIQRRSYNQAMAESGLGWSWNDDVYRRLLMTSGGKQRLRLLADATSIELSDDTIDHIHARKTELACAEIVERGVGLRPGVAELIREAQSLGFALGLVTSTYQENIDAIHRSAGDDLPLDRFSVIVTTADLNRGKPSPEAYHVALQRTGADPRRTVVIEDSAASVLSAAAAGLRVIATPGTMHDDSEMVGAELMVRSLGSDDDLDPAVLALLETVAETAD